MSIVLSETKLCVFCGPRESFWQGTKECAGMGNEDGRNTRLILC